MQLLVLQRTQGRGANVAESKTDTFIEYLRIRQLKEQQESMKSKGGTTAEQSGVYF